MPVQRDSLLHQLECYLASRPDERAMVERTLAFVRAHPDCFERSCVPGHVTGSAWILSHDRRASLLAHHAKLDRWLQCGGHSDGDPDTAAVALREAREESGLERLEFAQRDAHGVAQIFDVDIHVFPARGADPEHLHYDVRFLLIAAAGEEPRVSSESNALRWFPLAVDHAELADESLARLVRKARAWAVTASRSPEAARGGDEAGRPASRDRSPAR